MKHHPPITKGIGWLRAFRKKGFDVFLIDEYRSSKKCAQCQATEDKVGINKPFLPIINPRPGKKNQKLCHGVVKCQTCATIWDRDENASRNLWRVAHNALCGKERPEYLCRPTKTTSEGDQEPSDQD